jgi:hypothetical protein
LSKLVLITANHGPEPRRRIVASPLGLASRRVLLPGRDYTVMASTWPNCGDGTGGPHRSSLLRAPGAFILSSVPAVYTSEVIRRFVARRRLLAGITALAAATPLVAMAIDP